jgi:hypothetical protein
MKNHIHFKRYIKNDPSQEKAIDFYVGGDKRWFLNGEPHRLDGPAVEYSNGNKEWFLEGKFYIEEQDYWEDLEEYKISIKK